MTFELNLKCSQGNTWEMERKCLWKRDVLEHNMLKTMEFIYRENA